jgi:hypothetical protein
MLAVVLVTYSLLRRALGGGAVALGGWRWYPSWAAAVLLLPIAAFLAWRLSPALIFIPVILPFARGFIRRRPRSDDDGAIEGAYRPVDKA